MTSHHGHVCDLLAQCVRRWFATGTISGLFVTIMVERLTLALTLNIGL